MKLWSSFMLWSKGNIDVLVNNAANVSQSCDWRTVNEKAWDRVFQVNAKAPFLLGRAALGTMAKKRRGRIINLSSIGVKFGGSETTLHYSASKAALEAISKSLAKAGAPYNVMVNVVRIGVTDTTAHKKAGRKNLSGRIALIPLKRSARPSEISKVVLFLASEGSSFITNTTIDVAGGE